MSSSRTAFSFASLAAVAALTTFAASTVTPAFGADAMQAKASAKAVPCYGINACKGQSDCKSAKHDCKGQNDCKGQGFKEVSAKACSAKGGSLTAPEG